MMVYTRINGFYYLRDILLYISKRSSKKHLNAHTVLYQCTSSASVSVNDVEVS